MSLNVQHYQCVRNIGMPVWDTAAHARGTREQLGAANSGGEETRQEEEELREEIGLRKRGGGWGEGEGAGRGKS